MKKGFSCSHVPSGRISCSAPRVPGCSIRRFAGGSAEPRPSGSRLELLLSDDCLSASAATTYKSYYPERPSLCLTGNNMTTLRMIASRCASAAAGSFNGRSSGRNRKISKRTRQVIENARGRLISLGSSCGKAPVLSPLFGLGPP